MQRHFLLFPKILFGMQLLYLFDSSHLKKYQLSGRLDAALCLDDDG